MGHAAVEGRSEVSHETILARPAITGADRSTPDYPGAGGCPTRRAAAAAAATGGNCLAERLALVRPRPRQYAALNAHPDHRRQRPPDGRGVEHEPWTVPGACRDVSSGDRAHHVRHHEHRRGHRAGYGERQGALEV